MPDFKNKTPTFVGALFFHRNLLSEWEDEGGFLKTVDTYCFAARDEQTHMSRVCGARARRCPYALRESKLPDFTNKAPTFVGVLFFIQLPI